MACSRCISPDYFHSDDWFAQEVKNYIEFYKDSRPAEPDGEVLIPGEVELRLMKERVNTGLPLSQTSWKDLTQKAEKIGVDRKLVDQCREFLGIDDFLLVLK